MRIMGIDPGLRLTGYACVECPEPGDLSVVEAGVFRLRQKTTVADRLLELETDLVEALGRLRPSVVAVERVFSHARHPTTAAIMGHARGVILLCARRADLRLVELGATEVKKSLTGNGHASKAQVQGAVASQLGLITRPEPADVADAIAIALCCGRRMLSRHAAALERV
ncbi:MAG: crossover junction endodeoxyribonuclease RuvC [Phycisphaeraceae bacterium]|nr:crossover junction endodeoxyribonuclease RuvC [Phycisphaeraceae bacterium]